MTFDLNEINRIICKLNELEDSKFGQPAEKRIELIDRQLPLFTELYAKIGRIVCKF